MNTNHDSIGGNDADDRTRTLVVYDSPAGSTREVAEFIGGVLEGAGHAVKVMNVDGSVDLDHYDRVVVGGAIRYDRWMSGAAGFVQRHERTLSTIPVAYFFTAMALSAGTDASARKGSGYAQKIRDLTPSVTPVSVGGFAGVLDYSKVKGGPRLLIRSLMTVMRVDEGDYRDWDAIRSWTEEIMVGMSSSARRVA